MFRSTIGAIIPQSSTLADALYAIGWRRVAYVTGMSCLSTNFNF
jgi:phospholipid N-methyltransferase